MVLRAGDRARGAAVIEWRVVELDLLQQVVTVVDEGEILQPRDPCVDALHEEAGNLQGSKRMWTEIDEGLYVGWVVQSRIALLRDQNNLSHAIHESLPRTKKSAT